jgi:hypothetical protein
MKSSAPTDSELGDLEAAAGALSRRSFKLVQEGLDLFTASDGKGAYQLYARKEVVDEMSRALALAREEVPRLVEAVRALKGEVEKLRSREPGPPGPRAHPRPAGELGDVPTALVAPFRPSPGAVDAAKSDPLAALAVQVSRAMQPDATELDRARLIAMAFAATRGDMDTFWAATKQRSAKKLSGPEGGTSAG